MNPQQSAGPPGTVRIGSNRKRLFTFLGGLSALVIVAAIFFSVIGGGGNNFTPVITIAQDQTELIRIAKLGATKATGQTTLNVAFNLQLSLTSAQQKLLSYLADNHIKLGTKQLALKQNAQTTKQLSDAVATSSFDSTFVTVIQSQLGTYAQALKTAYNTNPGPKGRQLLSAQYNGAQLLIEQSKQTAP